MIREEAVPLSSGNISREAEKRIGKHNAKPMQNRLIKLVVKMGVSTCFKANSIRDRVLKTHKAMLNLSALCLLPIPRIRFTENKTTQTKNPTITFLFLQKTMMLRFQVS